MEKTYTFGEWELDTRRGELHCAGKPIECEPAVLEMLSYLIEHRDRVVSHEELIVRLWPGQTVRKTAVTRRIAASRRVTGDNGREQWCIKTLPHRGYQFVARVQERVAELPEDELPASRLTPSSSKGDLGDLPEVVSPTFLPEQPVGLPSGWPFPSLMSQSDLPQAGVGSHGDSTAAQRELDAERRHLTLLFCDLVDSTPLSAHLELEEFRDVVQAYYAVCTEVIERFDGHIAQYLGDGLLVYFGYPRAHEDDAQRAVRTGLGIIEALRPLQTRLQQEPGINLAVRIGIHTGLVVVGDMGQGARYERLVLGEAPNLAARLQGLAPANTVLISGTTAQLVQGWFVCEELGEQQLKGFARPIPVYRVLEVSGAQSRLDMVSASQLTPLVGREHEVALLLEHWERAKRGQGPVVMLSGEPGIGKTRLLRALQEHLAGEPYTRLECRCLPYTDQSALYPVIDLGRRLLRWQRDEPPDQTLDKLEAALAMYSVPLPEAAPLLASLLSLPYADRYPPLQLTPQRQKQKTLETILALLRAHAAQNPVLFIVEDLHWIDSSTLELLNLFIDQEPTGGVLTLLTSRPEFHAVWNHSTRIASLTLGRLLPTQVEQVMDQISGGKRLPAVVRSEVVTKTDGVPLFVEELTKMVIESGFLREQADHYELMGPLPALAIPTTLHDSLMARLDRLGHAKEIAQLGATLGRTFLYELLRAVSAWDEARLQHALSQLVEAELLYQQGTPPHVSYAFKHALIQDTAYQSLLRRKRQQYHQQTVQVLEQYFPEVVDTQPEFIAHHYTEAGLPAQALPYWQRAGQRAAERSANVEAISHFTKGLELLKAFPETPERSQQELTLHLAMGAPLLMLKGHTAPEVDYTYSRALALCQQVGDNRQRFSVMTGLWRLYLSQARLCAAHELGEQCLVLAQRMHNSISLQEAHLMLGSILFYLGELTEARTHLDAGITLYKPQYSRVQTYTSGTDPAVVCRCWAAWTSWLLGYPDQALRQTQEALTLAQELSHSYSLCFALHFASTLFAWRREMQLVQEKSEAVIALANEHGFARWLAGGNARRGWALVEQGKVEEGMPQLLQGLTTWRAMGGELGLPAILARLAEAYGKCGRAETGLEVLAEALALVHKNQERYYEAELHRLAGELVLCTSLDVQQAEASFNRALEIARRQQAKSWELRVGMSLSRLWHQQGKRDAAHALLAPIYGWFTEGFATSDVQEAKALLTTL
jgi:class 3 adenylate cyclase/predicted ATPase/DNA-binding winged helix-turn-helix (wHTH) protein